MTKDRLKWIISGLPRDGLSDKTWKMIEDFERYFDKHKNLTERQEEVLEKIFKEKGK